MPWIVGRAFTPAAGEVSGRQDGKIAPDFLPGDGKGPPGSGLFGKAVRGGRERPPYNVRLTGSRHKTVNPVHSRCPVGAGRKGTGEEQKLNDKQRPVRKNPRLAGFDYASRRFYFLTVCTKNRRPCLCRVTGTAQNPAIHLLPDGQIVSQELQALPHRVQELVMEQSVIMPDHLHLLLSIGCYGGQDPPALTRIVGNFKAGVSRRCGRQIWQASFYDHVIRGPADLQEIMQYIANNPRQWILDQDTDANPDRV